MIATEANIREVAEFRLRKRPHWVEPTVAKAIHYALRARHPADTAAQAVSWALTDLPGEHGSIPDVARKSYLDRGRCASVDPDMFAWCNDEAGHDGAHWCLQRIGYESDPRTGVLLSDDDDRLIDKYERREWK